METAIKRDIIEFFLDKPNERGTVKKVVDDETFHTVQFPASKRFPSFCRVYDSRPDSKTKGKLVTIRYVEGEPSIWVDEQYEHWDLNAYKKGEIHCTPIYFREGRLRVDAHNETLLEYLRTCRFNKANSEKYNFHDRGFFEFNPEQAAEQYISNTEREFKLEKLARECDIDKAAAIARVSGQVKHYNELLTLSPKEVRWYLIRFAKSDADGFEATFEDEQIGVKYDILCALDKGFLQWTGRYNDILTDSSTGQHICKAETGTDKLTFCAEYVQNKAPETYGMIRRKLGREIPNSALGATTKEPKDVLTNGTRKQIVEAMIEWHRDKDNGFKLFEVDGPDVKFNGVTLVDTSGNSSKGYNAAKAFLLDENQDETYKAVYQKWATQVNSK